MVNRGEGQRTATILAAEAKKLEKQLYAEGEHHTHARTHARHTDTQTQHTTIRDCLRAFRLAPHLVPSLWHLR